MSPPRPNARARLVSRRRIGQAALAAGFFRASAGDSARAAIGAPAPRFRLRAVPGTPWQGTFDLAQHLGLRPVLVTFFATWCRPCDLELPFLQRMHERFAAAGLVVVALAIDGPDSAAQIGPTIRRLKVTYPVLHDADSRISARANPRRLVPFLVAIDRKGLIAHEKDGWTAVHESRLPAEISNLLRS